MTRSQVKPEEIYILYWRNRVSQESSSTCLTTERFTYKALEMTTNTMKLKFSPSLGNLYELFLQEKACMEAQRVTKLR